ncbi:aldehyde dehydrogenase family protein [Aquincola tertiaricarbonis]|uniref:Aldehyde dehydrogenase family protein n=1 Tax=Aquincola tertiaricarbonis TaxID=391953 RepID=A0ABY4S4Z4_AQUTE|nr:aldehyde dehydrogenase family protein [Aquincola tertiaricarbonis]URI06926.1 aldehyde dehydrogenase family protein [Aquincola tertiaricarbonis]
MSQDHPLFIDGQARPASDGRTLTLVNPATQQAFGQAAAGTRADVDTAVAAARRELDGGAWSRLSGEARGRLLNKLADLVERDAELIADMDATCIGRPPIEPRLLDLPNAIGTLRTSAGWADKLEGRTIPTPGYLGQPTLSYTRREPVGVVGAIVPWNTPFMITCWKVGPALAAGCTVVIKPSEETPLSALHLARLCQEAGIPDGVVNVVPGLGEVVGATLCTHPGVDKITFTGSPEVGAIIQRTAGPLFKRVALELGGKSPQIVFDDADVQAAVQGCAMGIFFNQGQVCAAGSRILVQRGLAPAFGQALAAAAQSIRVGNPAEPGVQMGAVAKQEQYERINRYIAQGVAEGATLAAGGPSEARGGWFVQPTVFVDARNDMRIAREEIFGPVATVIPFDDEADAIRLANDTAYGLGATVWTRDVARGHRVAHAVKAGAVGINAWAPIDPRLPWGGMKTSGIGRECGLAGVQAYTEEKVITVLLG